MDEKKALIQDIQNLLNSYDTLTKTDINPNLLEFMDTETLKSIIGSLLDQKETIVTSDMEWLKQFKKEIN